MRYNREPFVLRSWLALFKAELFDARFDQLPAIPNCCVPYTTTLGWGAGFFIGRKLPPVSITADVRWLPEIAVGTEWWMGRFQEKEFLGYAVQQQVATPVYSYHRLQIQFAQVFSEFRHRVPSPWQFVRTLYGGVRVAALVYARGEQVEPCPLALWIGCGCPATTIVPWAVACSSRNAVDGAVDIPGAAAAVALVEPEHWCYYSFPLTAAVQTFRSAAPTTPGTGCGD